MVLESKQTTLAYRCPHCGAGVMTAVNLFHLKGSMVRLKCDCGKSAMEVNLAGNGKVRLTVPCIICPNPHHFTVSESIFFGSELFSLPCPYSDINICVMGEINHVKAELSRTELMLLELMEKNGITDFGALHGEEAEELLPDPQVLEIVMFVIRDLDAEGKISVRYHPAFGQFIVTPSASARTTSFIACICSTPKRVLFFSFLSAFGICVTSILVSFPGKKQRKAANNAIVIIIS